MALSCFGGILIATKITFVSFFLFPVLWFLILTPTWPQRILRGVALAVVPIAFALLILFYYHDFRKAPTEFNLSYILDFVQNSQVATPVPYPDWLKSTLVKHWASGSYIGFGAVIMPYLTVVGFIFARTRIWAAVALICSLIPHALIYKREHAISFIEPNFLFLIAAAHLVTIGVGSQTLNKPRFAVGIPALCTLLFAGWWLFLLPPGIQRTRNRITECNSTGREITAFIHAYAGKTLYLIPDNSYNVPTLDNAISKGGTDMHSNTWGDSPFMVALFPDRTYLFGYSPLAQAYDLRPFSKIVTTILHGNAQATYDKLKSQFQIELSEYDRRLSYKINPHVEVVGYVRKQELKLLVSPLIRILPSEISSPLYVSPRELKTSYALVPTPEPHWVTTAKEAGPYMSLCYDTDYRLEAGTTLQVRARVGTRVTSTVLLQVTLRSDGESQGRTLGREFTIHTGQKDESLFSVLLDRGTVVENISIGLANVTPGSEFTLHSLTAESLTYAKPTPPAERL